MTAPILDTPTIGGIAVRPDFDAIQSIRCTHMRNGRVCDHLILRWPVALWEQAIADEVEVECRRCGSVAKLKEWR